MAREQVRLLRGSRFSVQELDLGPIPMDLAWVETLLKGGDVYAVATDELPVDAPIAGLVRF